MFSRLVLAALVLSAPVAQAAELAIRAVVIRSARVSVQSPERVLVTTREPQAVQVNVQPADNGGLRVVLTP